jgi:hypothetical protein
MAASADGRTGRNDDRGAGQPQAAPGMAGHNDDRGAGQTQAGPGRAGRNDDRGAGRPQAAPAAAPVLAVVRGDASAEEIAALVTVLMARNAGSPSPAAVTSRWSSRQALLRGPLSHGPGAWRASALPG